MLKKNFQRFRLTLRRPLDLDGIPIAIELQDPIRNVTRLPKNLLPQGSLANPHTIWILSLQKQASLINRAVMTKHLEMRLLIGELQPQNLNTPLGKPDPRFFSYQKPPNLNTTSLPKNREQFLRSTVKGRRETTKLISRNRQLLTNYLQEHQLLTHRITNYLSLVTLQAS